MAVPPPPLSAALPAAAAAKPALRAALRARRRAFVALLDEDERAALLADLASRLIPHLGGARCIAGYVAAGSELDPAPLLRRLAKGGASIALPRVEEPDGEMRLLAWTIDMPLTPGAFGLLQPPADAPEVAPDVFLAPLLGFDRALGRIGQGAGFYDRAFAAHPHARRIGLAWSVQEEPAIPRDPWDVPLHAIATEREWIA